MRLVAPAGGASLFFADGSVWAAQAGAGMMGTVAALRETAEADAAAGAGEDSGNGETAGAGEREDAGMGPDDGVGNAAVMEERTAEIPEIITPLPVSNQLASRSG